MNWIRHHKLLTFALAFVVLLLLGSVTGAAGSTVIQLVLDLALWILIAAGIVNAIVSVGRKSSSQVQKVINRKAPEQKKEPERQREVSQEASQPKPKMQVPKIKPIRTIEDLDERLNAVVGLEEAKNTLREIFATAMLEKKRNKQGIRNEEGMSLHMVFTGNPGTGKTKMARIVGEMFAGIGVLSKGTFVEMNQSGLVGQYVGETPLKVMGVVESSIGGVLFIDEAYALADGHYANTKSHGKEAIDTLISEMENHRKDLCVIFAGYPAPMEKMLDANEGLRSRVPFHVHFEDYSPQEMLTIAIKEAKIRQYSLTKSAADKLYYHFKHIDIGGRANGRHARNLVEAAIRRFALRVLEEKLKDLTVLTDKDFDLSDNN